MGAAVKFCEREIENEWKCKRIDLNRNRQCSLPICANPHGNSEKKKKKKNKIHFSRNPGALKFDLKHTQRNYYNVANSLAA